ISRSLSIFTILLISVPGILAQTQGRISGTVTDANGAVVAGATVTVKNEKTSETRTVTATGDGTFMIAALQPSTYTITANGGSFQPTTQTGVQILAGQELNLS